MRFGALLGVALWALWSVAFVAPANALLPPSHIVFLSTGSAEIRQAGDNVLREVASTFHKIGIKARVFIGAHTDSAEAQSLSATLSSERGTAAKQRLIELGIPADRIWISVYGDSRPWVITPAGSPQPQNRRAEIVVALPE
ncbi:OmpA family protein [Reyranella sp.]|uniref:OmpA family protein n=1 Tax=Reyranella sp. TaxID=1929291 RepID=UPI0025FEA90A|nr:OmpA family protein [Reyranella sp.]